MLALVTFLGQLIILFLLARSFAKNFFQFWFLVTKSKNWAIRVSSFFLFPGTLIHELAHWLAAEILQVKTGKLTLWPLRNQLQIDNEAKNDEGIRLGSVQIARCDPFRRTLIGLAPLLAGLIIIVGAAQFLPANLACWEKNCLAATGLVVLIIFLISNTMFASRKDLEAAFVPFFMISLLAFAWWYFDWPIPQPLTVFFNQLLTKLNTVFTITIVINLVFLLLVKVLTTGAGKLLKRKLVLKLLQ